MPCTKKLLRFGDGLKIVAILQLEDVVPPAAAVEVLPDEELLVFLESCRSFEVWDTIVALVVLLLLLLQPPLIDVVTEVPLLVLPVEFLPFRFSPRAYVDVEGVDAGATHPGTSFPGLSSPNDVIFPSASET